jgi:hypothetical protein
MVTARVGLLKPPRLFGAVLNAFAPVPLAAVIDICPCQQQITFKLAPISGDHHVTVNYSMFVSNPTTFVKALSSLLKTVKYSD